MAPSRTKNFKKTQKEWEQKLKAAGFEDAEKDGNLKDYHSTNWNNEEGVLRMQASQAYFDRCTEVFRKHKFKNPKEKLVWLLHSRGYTVRDIENKFEKWFTEGRLKKSAASKIVRAVSLEVGLRHE